MRNSIFKRIMAVSSCVWALRCEETLTTFIASHVCCHDNWEKRFKTFKMLEDTERKREGLREGKDNWKI